MVGALEELVYTGFAVFGQLNPFVFFGVFLLSDYPPSRNYHPFRHFRAGHYTAFTATAAKEQTYRPSRSQMSARAPARLLLRSWPAVWAIGFESSSLFGGRVGRASRARRSLRGAGVELLLPLLLRSPSVVFVGLATGAGVGIWKGGGTSRSALGADWTADYIELPDTSIFSRGQQLREGKE